MGFQYPFIMLFSQLILLVDIEESDVVLGTQWVRTLGPICLDLNKMIMKFEYSSRWVELKGIKGPMHKGPMPRN